MASIDDFYRLLGEADEQPYGASRIAIVEEAVRIADVVKDEQAAFRGRLALIEAAIFGGYAEKAIIAFSWCSGKVDSDADTFRAMSFFGVDLLWAYKWIGQHTHAYTSISREQILSTLADMERRYETHQLSFRPVYMQRVRNAYLMGDEVDTETWFQKFRDSKRDSYADCKACEQNFEVEFWLENRNYDKASKAAEPIVNGEMSCAEVPHITFSLLTVPAALAGDTKADEFHASGYRLTCDNRDFLLEVAEHLDFVSMHNDLDRSVALMERHLPWAFQNLNDKRRLSFYAAAKFACDRLIAGDRSNLALRLPAGMPVDSVGGVVSVDELGAYLGKQASETASAFDKRNANTFVSDQLRARHTELNAFAESTG